MKKLATLIAAAVITGASAFAGTPVKATALPKAALTFIAEHFPGDTVRKAEKDNGRRGTEYEVDLSSGAEIDFRDNGDWKDVKAARGKAVPAAIVPAAIAKHVASNSSPKSPASAAVTKWNWPTAPSSNSPKTPSPSRPAKATATAATETFYKYSR